MARPADLLSAEEARRRILARFQRLPAETLPLQELAGRFLAEAVRAPISLPPFANSAMDGYALASRATQGATRQRPLSLRVVEHIPAGSSHQLPIGPGQCARIMTGAPVPPGADAVVPFEEVEDRVDAVLVFAPLDAGSSVRPAGNDLKAGTIVMEAGDELGAPQIALLAALGLDRVPVVRRPAVAVLATGDELVEPGKTLGAGQIYNSNTPMLAAAVEEAGGAARVIDVAGDDPLALTEAMERGLNADLLVTSGGASVGDFDHVKDVIGSEGELGFWRVRVRPGKPLIFGSVGATPVIGLPGNPTSSMVTFEQFVRPAIRTMLGASPLRPEIDAVADETIDNRGGRRTYFRVRLEQREGRFHARLAGRQDSAMLLPLAHADGLLVVGEDQEEVQPGTVCRVQVWRLPA